MTSQTQIHTTSGMSGVTRTDTEYVVLVKDESGFWSELGRRSAKTPEQAITAAIGDADPGKDQWVAIAARYWSPVSFDVKVERSLIPKAAK